MFRFQTKFKTKLTAKKKVTQLTLRGPFASENSHRQISIFDCIVNSNILHQIDV